MKVICIDDTSQFYHDLPFVKKGNIYNVVEVVKNEMSFVGGHPAYIGDHYILAECGNSAAFYYKMFIQINEDQQDETTFERDYNKSLVK